MSMETPQVCHSRQTKVVALETTDPVTMGLEIGRIRDAQIMVDVVAVVEEDGRDYSFI